MSMDSLFVTMVTVKVIISAKKMPWLFAGLDNHIQMLWNSIYMGMYRMLGYHSGKPTSDSHFGKVTEDFGMDEVSCTGSEASILDCAYEKVHDCGEDEGAGVICCECQLHPSIFLSNN